MPAIQCLDNIEQHIIHSTSIQVLSTRLTSSLNSRQQITTENHRMIIHSQRSAMWNQAVRTRFLQWTNQHLPIPETQFLHCRQVALLADKQNWVLMIQELAGTHEYSDWSELEPAFRYEHNVKTLNTIY